MAALSMLFMAKLVFLPSIVEFASLELPRMYDSFLTWLTPPYLLFFVNCIIVTIAATSHFQKNDPSSASTSLAPVSIDGDSYCHMKTGLTEMGSPVQYVDEEEVKVAGSELITPVEHFEHFETFEAFGGVSKAAAVVMEETKSVEEEEEFVISRSNWTPIIRRGSGEIYSGEEKAPVSSRFGSRKSVKASPDGKTNPTQLRSKKNHIFVVSISCCFFNYRKGIGSDAAKEERDDGEHVEDDDGRETNTSIQALEEIRNIGGNCSSAPRARRRQGFSTFSDDNCEEEKIGEFQRKAEERSIVAISGVFRWW